MEIAAKTWPEGWAKGGGAAVWGSMVYDPDFNTVYFGTDSAAPLNAEARSPGGGDNLFTNSIVAVDADSGEYKWHYQTVPHDTWDYNANMPIMLAELEIEEKKRKVLMQAPKSGFFYVIDRDTGKFISLRTTMFQCHGRATTTAKRGGLSSYRAHAIIKIRRARLLSPQGSGGGTTGSL